MKIIRSMALIGALVFLLALSVPLPASAEMMDTGKMGEMMGMCMEHAEKLGLTHCCLIV